jgi:hypothetical protein
MLAFEHPCLRCQKHFAVLPDVHFPVSFNLQDESQDIYKRQQLRELALLNLSYREESPGPSGSVSPFTSSGMKRVKTGQ